MTTTPRLWKSQTQVNTTDADSQFDGQIAGLSDGGYVVVWTDRTLTLDDGAIFGQRYDSAGNKVGGEVPLTLSLPNANLPTGSRFAVRSRSCPTAPSRLRSLISQIPT